LRFGGVHSSLLPSLRSVPRGRDGCIRDDLRVGGESSGWKANAGFWQENGRAGRQVTDCLRAARKRDPQRLGACGPWTPRSASSRARSRFAFR
jgi:hypothetical protein